jgi:two-component system, OmpR family, response regulator
MRVLVVEDEPAMAAVLDRGLREQGFAVDVAADGSDGLWYAREYDYNAIVLDVGLPGRDGFELLCDLRRAGSWVPVLFLTARDAVEDRVRGLDLGADDYLTKPFAFDELLARLRVMLRSGARPRPPVLTVGNLRLDPAERAASCADRQLALTAKEFALLECLMRRPGEVLTRADLIEQVWDADFDHDSNVIDVYVASLRRKLGRPLGARVIQTVRGVGYRLVAGHADG